ncbi:MAG TPA: hypothetical protein VIF83_07895 [Gemmatimonadaceae bacterium]
MMNTRILALFLLLPIGCSNPPTEPLYHIPKPDEGSVTLTVNVSGDPTLLQSLFSAHFNDLLWLNIQPNEPVQVPLKQGDYSVRLSPLSSREWCSALEPTSVSARVEAGKSQPVFFSVNCPALVGRATVRLAVEASGVNLPNEFQIRVTRVIGSRLSFVASVRRNDSTDVLVPVGAYHVSYESPSNCAPRSILDFLGFAVTPTYIVRADETARTKLTVICRAIP